MAKRNVIITVVLMLLFVATAGFAQDDQYQWKLVDTEDNCQIYTSVVPGKDYIAAKTTCLIPARIEVIGTVLRDIDNYPEWMEDCKETKVLKVVDDEKDVIIFWFRQHVTLLTDRDMVLKSKTVIDMENGRNLVYADLTNDMAYDAGKGYARMPSFYSLYTLQWVDREHTKVTFMINPDLGKGVPTGIANATIKKIPYKSLKKMMKMVKLSKYVEAAKTSKYNKMAEDFVKAGHK
ncbi:MAG: START domain-containing protein [Deltaproteobacteria bacterium]|nr:START domain-containing protein [Deltaproteobacteria bacterium]